MFLKYFCMVAAFATCAVALSPEERAALNGAMLPIFAKCSSEFGVSEDAVNTAKTTVNADNLQPCFIACAFKEFGIINEQGQFDIEQTIGKTKQFVQNEEDLNKIKAIGEACSSVNSEPVSGDNPDCERAKSLVNCFIKNKGDFSPFV